MTQEEEIESLQRDLRITKQVLKIESERLVQAIIHLVKVLPIANNRAVKTPREQTIIHEAQLWLQD
jgi:hypothetical protein